MRDIRRIWPFESQLGEGPCWHEGALWFVDIESQFVHCVEPDTQEKCTWPAPGKVSFILPEQSGRFIVGMPGVISRFTPADGIFETLVRLDEDQPHNRVNDACIDSSGRLWFGTMDGGERNTSGALYSWDGKTAPLCRDRGYTISNGPAFSPDGHTFYHTDTLNRTVYGFDVDDNGTLTNKQPFIRIEDRAGWPDGTTVDEQGCLWIALYGGACVRRYSPDGQLLASVPLPCANITKLAFGGEDLKTAFVTTARQRLDPEALRAQSLAGGLFAFSVEVPGLPQQCARI